jgi:deferrochelatase/peroxidase EfeB
LLHAELRSDLADETPQTSKTEPPPETGELGFSDGFDRYHLTVTVGFAASAYEKLGVPANERPQDLIPIPWEQLGDKPDLPDNGDLVLQICSDSVYIAEHVLRRIEHELASTMRIVWCVAGQQRHTSRSGRVNRGEGRALIGFLDGTANLDPAHDPDASQLVFVDPDEVSKYPPQVTALPPGQPSPYGSPQPPEFPRDLRQPPASEPAWTHGGTYMVVRASLIDITSWDTTGLGDQEHTIGRWKYSGNALDQPDDDGVAIAEPNFAGDPTGQVTPVTAHIRKANPRGPDDADRRIFRRGYPLIAAAIDGPKRGLVFICFGRTITTQFEFVTRAWTNNPNFPSPSAGVDAFRRFEHVLAGGYYFVPPLERAREPWSWIVPS